MRISLAEVGDAEALTDLHLDVWEQTYANLIPAAVFRERRADREQRIERWRAIGFYRRQGFGPDGATKPEDVGLERRMVRCA